MISHRSPAELPSDDILGLQESVRLLSVVAVALSERIEILETRETLQSALRFVRHPERAEAART
jgi:hypothetical protein